VRIANSQYYSTSFPNYRSSKHRLSLFSVVSISENARFLEKRIEKYKTCSSVETNINFYVSLTVHLSITLANDQLDAQILNTFITVLYMYMKRAISSSSSEGQIVLIQHLLSSLTVSDRPVHRTVTYGE